MNEEFEINEIHSTFDFKGFLIKLLSYWPLFVISLIIAFGIANYVNVRKLPVYMIGNMVSIKDDQNPFFTTNTSLTFNWGGTTDKVNTALITLQSRSHNEKVVERLQYYLVYLKDGKYQKEDAYKKTPFMIKVDTVRPQLLWKQFKIVFKDSTTFNLSLTVEQDGTQPLQYYNAGKSRITRFIEAQEFSRDFKLGDTIKLPFFSGVVYKNPAIPIRPNNPFYFNFLNFDTAVKSNRGINVVPESKGSSILKMVKTGPNKAKIVDYLNTSVKVLSQGMLDRKNLFATKTIKFIDSSLQGKSIELLEVEDELNLFKDQNEIFDLETEGKEINAKLNGLDVRKEGVNRELNYYGILENYLIGRTDYRDVPAPSVAGISESSIGLGVSQIVSKAQERNKLQYSYQEGAPIFDDIDRQIDAIKRVLLENITSSKGLKRQELAQINTEIAKYEAEIRKLPKEQQELLKIQRRYNLSQSTYNLFLAKRSEADLVKAANVSDVMIIDSAKDTGGGMVGPNTRLNYVMAAMFGFLAPFLFAFMRVFLDNRVHTTMDLEKLSKVPILGVIGKSRLDSNLAVIDKPKSAIAEAFRGLRSSLQFIYKKQGIEGSKTVLVTSSISGEGKTFCSINIASVFALSEKKTVLIGLDLRKPKIFGDFDINNDLGVVNYLIGDATAAEIIQKTQVPSLDVITAGPIPPNPSELLMSDRMEELIISLKTKYDYIVLDSPPVGLVSDSLELVKFADATVYLVRQNYTKRAMFGLINEKYKKGEVSNISFVLNFFEGKARYGYGYGYGYGKGYGYGYGYGYGQGHGYHDDDKKPSLLGRIRKFFKRKKR